MTQFLPEPGAEHLRAPDGNHQTMPSSPPLSFNYASNRAEEDRPLCKRTTGELFGLFTHFPSQGAARQDNLHSIAKLMADSLALGDPHDPLIQRALSNSLKLAFQTGGEDGEAELLAEINSHLMAPLSIERINELPPITQEINSQRVYVLRDRDTNHNISVAAFEIDGQVEPQE